ncbi:cyclic di-GMP phosphodiesterase TpdA [Vibrio campbellii]|nr:EAL domain-containing protein [Vibrio campbellii]AQM66548.1 Putative cyclic-di-GMP phosphodiesterase AdrB [Vibrio campbellii]KGR33991.1 sensory box/GGDEF family protein [Vibrio campbellii]MCR9906870.1 EAL domain-containing protein [Vibrio campbellii]OQQ05086.1 EAL domain-containing protein [Vibrio campbellii]
MIRFELGNQICVCLTEKELSLQLNNSIHSSIPVNRIEYLILSTIAAFGSLNAPISQRKIEKKLSAQHHLMLPENGFKNAVASIRKKFRQLTKNHIETQKSLIENIHRKGYFVPYDSQHAQKDGLLQQARIHQQAIHSLRMATGICLRSRVLYLNVLFFLLIAIALYIAICFYTISTIVRQNYFDDAMNFAQDLAQRSCFQHEAQLRGLFDNIQLVESALMTDKHNIRCLVTPEAVVPVNQKDSKNWLNNESYTTHSFSFNGAEVLVRVKNINLSNNIESHMSQMFLSGMKVCTNTGTALEIGDTKGDSFLYNVNDNGYKEIYYVSGPISSILILSFILMLMVRHKELRALMAYMWAIRQFNLKLEPIHNTSNRQNIHYEVLSRFKVKNTQRFIESLIANGLLLNHTLLVIKTIYADSKSLLAPLSINVCPSLLEGRNFARLYRQLSQLDCSLLTIEITENASMYYTREIFDNINKLKEIGCKISIDDFGTGNNNVELISHITPNYLKIDRLFVMNLKQDDKKVETLRQLIAMGHTYHCTVIVEGVETAECAHLLTTLGAHIHQGFYYPLCR